jgi:hypothetical protein
MLNLTRFDWNDTGQPAWETSTELAGTVSLTL